MKFAATCSLPAAGMLILTACAVVPLAPTDAVVAAGIAVANAEQERAADVAPLEMRTAREKLSAARDGHLLVDQDGVVRARRLADEARADADLAVAKARLSKATAINQDMQKSGNTLRQEAERGSGV